MATRVCSNDKAADSTQAEIDICLSCPLPECLLALGIGGRHRLLRREADERILRLYEEGKACKEIVKITGVHIRTIYRRLAGFKR